MIRLKAVAATFAPVGLLAGASGVRRPEAAVFRALR